MTIFIKTYVSHFYGDLFLFVINFCLESQKCKDATLEKVTADKIAAFDLLIQV